MSQLYAGNMKEKEHTDILLVYYGCQCRPELKISMSEGTKQRGENQYLGFKSTRVEQQCKLRTTVQC